MFVCENQYTLSNPRQLIIISQVYLHVLNTGADCN